jgi:hypothetical protein
LQTYYLDESGTTGDLARNAEQGFGGQRVFALACLGVEDSKALGAELTRLMRHHRVQHKELKSLSVIRKPRLVADLIRHLREHQYPVFLEVVDKRFFVIAMLVNHLLRVPMEAGYFPVRVALAEYLTDVLPEQWVFAYCRLCSEQSESLLCELLATLIALGVAADDKLIGEALRRFAQRALDEFDAAGPARAVAPFLPIPDTGKKGQIYWMLPELTSLTGIYGRLNRFHGRNMSDVLLVHDEHAHFDEIFQLAKQTAEGLVEQGVEMVLNHSDYRFRTRANLKFARSVDEPGIQAADVLAGFAMRYIQDRLMSHSPLTDGREEVFTELVGLAAPFLPMGVNLGVNLVVAESDLDRLGIPH